MPTPGEEMRIVAVKMQPLEVPFVFVGGAVMPFLVDRPDLTDFRPTKDVDVVVAISSYESYARLEERLRDRGFIHDTSEGAPICRWIVDGCRVDIMPAEPSGLGMNTRWFPQVLQMATDIDLGEDCRAKAVSPSLFLATKFEAFKDRGDKDYYGSKDLEDIVTLIDGRGRIVEEVAAAIPEVRDFLAGECARLLRHPDFADALIGHLSVLFGARSRASIVRERFETISKLGT
jgi:predicted nucleotidyltransferase